MGERKGTNKYYPPDYDPKKGGLNAYHGTHALRERARKLHEGILIIRFEMPYNIWCNGCGNHIGMGVRYNAQKRKMGSYYTTPIYKFRMKCHLCDQHFEIQTDPKNCDYEILSGCRRKEGRWDTEKAGNVQTLDREVKKKLMTNAMYKLEHGASDQQKARKIAPTMTRLEEIRDTWKDDFAINQALRKKFRDEKRDIDSQDAIDNDVKSRASLPNDLKLLEEVEEDVKKAKRIRFGQDSNIPDVVRKLRKRDIKEASIFKKSSNNKIELAEALARKTSSSSFKSRGSCVSSIQRTKSNALGVSVKSRKNVNKKQNKTNNEISCGETSKLTETKNSSSCNKCVEICKNLKKSFESCKPLHTISSLSAGRCDTDLRCISHDTQAERESEHSQNIMPDLSCTSQDHLLKKPTISLQKTDADLARNSLLLVDYNSSSSSVSEVEET